MLAICGSTDDFKDIHKYSAGGNSHMSDSLHDDVKELLDGDFGDDRILKQILRACENNEVISNYERTYVKKLKETYLGKKPQASPEPIHAEEEPVIPDVVIPKISLAQKVQTVQARPQKAFLRFRKGLVVMGVIGIVAVAAAAAVVLYGGTYDLLPRPITETSPAAVEEEPPAPVAVSLSVQTDMPSL